MQGSVFIYVFLLGMKTTEVEAGKKKRERERVEKHFGIHSKPRRSIFTACWFHQHLPPKYASRSQSDAKWKDVFQLWKTFNEVKNRCEPLQQRQCWSFQRRLDWLLSCTSFLAAFIGNQQRLNPLSPNPTGSGFQRRDWKCRFGLGCTDVLLPRSSI